MLKSSQLKSYNYLEKDEQNREMLQTDDDFVTDARTFLTKREGYSVEDLDNSEKVYDAYMEHFRYQDVNEVTAIRDLQYAQNANQEEKARFGRLTMLYDSKANEGVFDAAGDYFQGIATAPSTYLGVVSGGAGKLATIAGLKAAKLALNKILMGGVKKSIARGAIVEGTIGTGQGIAQEMTKVETNYKDEVSLGTVALTGGVSAIAGGAFSGLAGLGQSALALKATDKLDVAQKAAAKTAKSANLKAKKVLKKATLKQKKFVSDQLNALDPKKTALGDELLKDIADSKKLGTLKAGLPLELFENISAAAIELQIKMGSRGLKFKDGDRITTVLQDALSRGKDGGITSKEIDTILREYNLTPDQFSLIYKAELSAAGKTLNVQSRIVQSLKVLEESGYSTFTQREAKDMIDATKGGKAKASLQLLKDIDRVRLGFMTSQPATTMRNNFGGGFRIAVEMATRSVDNILNQKIFGGTRNAGDFFDGITDLGKFVLNPYEAGVTRKLLEKGMPDTARKLFRDAADLASTTGGESKLAKVGTKINYLNTMSDNFFKQAMLSTSLKQRLKDAVPPQNLDDIIAKGEFNLISKDIINDAVEDALQFTYQSSFYSKDAGILARGTQRFLKFHRDVPLVISSFVPFPRFIANQMKFLYNHAPVIGLLGLENIGKKKVGYVEATLKGLSFRKNTRKYAQQAAGLGLLGVAYNWRAQQGPDASWNEIKDDQGNYINAMPMYGPFSAFMLAADILYRWRNSDVAGETNLSDIAETKKQYWREAAQAVTGSQFRTGYGFYAIDKLVDDIYGEGDPSDKGVKITAEFLGNILNTFTLPLSVIKDLYTPFDKESRTLPETETGVVDFIDLITQRGFRALPDLGENTPVVGKKGFASVGIVADALDLQYDMPKSDPFMSGSPEGIDPLEKQLFGFTKRPPKNSLQSEMGKLNLPTYEVYRRDPNPSIDITTRIILSKVGGKNNLNEEMAKHLISDNYRGKKSQQAKRNYIMAKAQEIIARAKNEAKLKINQFAAENDQPFSPVHIAEWDSVPSSLKKEVVFDYKQFVKDNKIQFLNKRPKEITNIFTDRNKSIVLGDGSVVNLLQWAIDHSKIKKKIKGD